MCSAVLTTLREASKDGSFEVIEGLTAWAEPGGLLKRETFETLRDEILDEISKALPLDAVVLGLHGAMVAQGYHDCEGDLLERVREIVGNQTIIAACLDPHSHLTERRVRASNILAAFHEFPHTDFVERATHVVNLAISAARGQIKPIISTFDCRMIDVYPTSQSPMREFVDRMVEQESKGDILSISLIHGFMAADVPEMGTQLLVVSDGNRQHGDEIARRFGKDVIALRGRTSMLQVSIEEAAAEIRSRGATTKPIVVADVWDNPGGGVPGDGTSVLRAFLAEEWPMAVASIWDPVAVSICEAAGVGSVINLRFGGKSGPDAGEPIDAHIEVIGLKDDLLQSFGRSTLSLGRSAVIRPVGTQTDIILSTKRLQALEPDVFSNCGIDINTKRVLLLKSTNHFYAGFKPIAEFVLYVSAPGFYPFEPAKTKYRNIAREFWPRVADPWGREV